MWNPTPLLVFLFFVCSCTAKNCVSNANCTKLQICSNGTCVDRSRATNLVEVAVGTTGSPCTSNAQCEVLYLCTVSGYCVPNPFFTSTTTTAATTTTSEATCGSNWRRFQDFCFLPVHGQFSYFQANAFCASQGAQLATVNTYELVNFVYDTYVIGGNSPFWIGLRKVGDAWVWPNGTFAYQTFWRPSQPDGCCGADVTCVVENYDSSGPQWDDSGCYANSFGGQNFGFVCERRVGATGSNNPGYPYPDYPY